MCGTAQLAELMLADFLLHSADSTESEFKKIGWKTSNWEKQIRPAGWEYPSYASQDAVGKVFILVSYRYTLRIVVSEADR